MVDAMPTIGWPQHGSNGSDGADHNRDARLEPLVDAAHLYLLDRSEARDIIETQVATIRAAWSDACDATMLTAHERDRFWERQFLNPHAFQA